MIAVALAAVLCRWPGLAYFAIPPAAHLVAERAGWLVGGRGRLAILLGAVYLPCLPGFLMDCDHCRLAWLQLFPITPTLAPTALAASLLGIGRLSEPVEFALAAIALCVLVGALFAASCRGRAWLIGCATVGLGWSAFWAWGLAALIRA